MNLLRYRSVVLILIKRFAFVIIKFLWKSEARAFVVLAFTVSGTWTILLDFFRTISSFNHQVDFISVFL